MSGVDFRGVEPSGVFVMDLGGQTSQVADDLRAYPQLVGNRPSLAAQRAVRDRGQSQSASRHAAMVLDRMIGDFAPRAHAFETAGAEQAVAEAQLAKGE